MRLTRRALLLTTLSAPAIAFADELPRFPTIRGRDLTGASVTSDSFRGKPWLIAIGFDPTHSDEMERWAAAFVEAFPDQRAEFYTIAAISSRLVAFRKRMDRDLARDKDEKVRRRIMTVYAADSVARDLKIRDRKSVHLFALDAEGRIVAREHGKFTPAAFQRLRSALDGKPAAGR